MTDASDNPALAEQLDLIRQWWSFQYDIAFDKQGHWRARHVTSGEILAADTSMELSDMINDDYAERRDRAEQT
jgi:hypothetical protein